MLPSVTRLVYLVTVNWTALAVSHGRFFGFETASRNRPEGVCSVPEHDAESVSQMEQVLTAYRRPCDPRHPVIRITALICRRGNT